MKHQTPYDSGPGDEAPRSRADHDQAPDFDVSHLKTLALLAALKDQINNDLTKGMETTESDPLTADQPGFIDRLKLARHTALRRPAALVAVAISCLLSAAGVAGLLWSRSPKPDEQNRSQIESSLAAPAAPPVAAPVELPTGSSGSVLQTVRAAMAECDHEAARNPFTLYFLVIPVKSGGISPSSAGDVERHVLYSLLNSTVLLNGLGDGSLTLDPTTFGFSIIDSATKKTKAWAGATGVSKFKHDDTSEFSAFSVGFNLNGRDAEWSNRYQRRTGICYWVNARFHAG